MKKYTDKVRNDLKKPRILYSSEIIKRKKMTLWKIKLNQSLI